MPDVTYGGSSSFSIFYPCARHLSPGARGHPLSPLLKGCFPSERGPVSACPVSPHSPCGCEIDSRLSRCPSVLLPHLEGSSGAVLPACLWWPFHRPRKWTEMCACPDNTFPRHEPSVLALPLCSLVSSPQPQLFPLPVWEPRGGPKATCSSVCICCPCSAFLPPATTSFIWNGPWKPSKLGPPVPQANQTMDKDPFSPTFPFRPQSHTCPCPVDTCPMSQAITAVLDGEQMHRDWCACLMPVDHKSRELWVLINLFTYYLFSIGG